MPPPTSLEHEVLRLRRERDLYRRLVRLGEVTDLEPFLREALSLVVEIAGARQGYLELTDDAAGEPRRWSIAHGFSEGELDEVRRVISRGIIAESLATGETVHTGSATLDPRFRYRDSVRSAGIEAVVCAPIGDDPPIGVVYLQCRTAGGAFGEDDRATAEEFARHLAPFAGRLLELRRGREVADPIRELRARMRLEGVVGRSEALAATLRQLALVAPLDVDVLLLGETGTGKTQLARVVHDNSARAGGPFVELNCAALPESLIESELFGALPGAHSTATHRIEGKVGAAHRGTLVLDEIAELPPASQGKLLQLIQSRQYFPLGASKPVTADVRLVAATNVDLEAAVAARRFREDLYYRLQVVPIRVPSLVERREDVAPLAEHVIATTAQRYRLPRLPLSPGALRALESAEWPGNVRQLEHCVQRALIRAAGEAAQQVERTHVFSVGAAAGSPDPPTTFQEATRRFQAQLLRGALEETGWNVVETAKRLDVARSHLYSLIRAFGLERKSG